MAYSLSSSPLASSNRRTREVFHYPGKEQLTPSDADAQSFYSYGSSTGSKVNLYDVDEKEEEREDEEEEQEEQEQKASGLGDVWSEKQDFLWMYTEEPHRSRRMAILKAHPEVRKLMGPTLWTPPLVLVVLSTQVTLSILLRNSHPFSPLSLLTAYIIGGTLNQNTFLAIHEITHNLAFKRVRSNKLLAILANLAIGVPYAMAFKGYHIEHHKFLGEDGIDTDIPSKMEAVLLNNVAGKTFFATFQLLFYALRPGFIRSQTPTIWHAINIAAVLIFDSLLVHFFGWRPLIYLLLSSFFAGSLHPCAAHFIAEHYLMNQVTGEEGGPHSLGQETTSYYGWLNILCYNVGYHNEHHDFPSIPWTRLPQLRSIAHEFYDEIPAHKSWPYVTYQFITDPKVGMFSRVKRMGRGEKIDERVWSLAAKARLAKEKGVESEQSGTEEDERVSEVEMSDDADALEIGYASDRDIKSGGKAKTKAE